MAEFALKEKGDGGWGEGKMYYWKPEKSLSKVEHSGGACNLWKHFHQQLTPSACGNKSYSV